MCGIVIVFLQSVGTDMAEGAGFAGAVSSATRRESVAGGTPYYYAIDGLRFAAALSVALWHLAALSAVSETETGKALGGVAQFPTLASWVGYGWVGVEVFFVISGFVIANSAHAATAFAFARGRFLRLYPTAWICSLFTLAAWFAIGAPGDIGRRFVDSMTIWIKGPWLDPVMWTLAVEIIFYAVVFFLIAAGQFKRLPTLAWLFAVSSTIYVADKLFVHKIPLFSYDYVVQYLGLFAAGMFLWLLTQERKLSYYLGVILSLISGSMMIATRTAQFPSATPILDFIPIAILVASVLFIGASSQAQPTSFKRTRWQRVLRLAGLLTYPVYLLHDIAGTYFMRLLIVGGMPPHLALIAALIAVGLVAYAICRYLEPGLVNMLGLRKRKDRTEQTTEIAAVPR